MKEVITLAIDIDDMGDEVIRLSSSFANNGRLPLMKVLPRGRGTRRDAIHYITRHLIRGIDYKYRVEITLDEIKEFVDETLREGTVGDEADLVVRIFPASLDKKVTDYVVQTIEGHYGGNSALYMTFAVKDSDGGHQISLSSQVSTPFDDNSLQQIEAKMAAKFPGARIYSVEVPFNLRSQSASFVERD